MAGESELQIPEGISNLMSKIPSTMGTPVAPDKGDAGDLTAEQKAALADAELQKRNQQSQQSKKEGQNLPVLGGDNKDDNEETEEQIQAKLDEIAAKDEKDYTDDDKAYIEKYAPQEETPIVLAKNTVTQRYSIDLKDKNYENGPQGLVELVEDVAPLVAKQMVLEHFETIPMMKEFYEHVSQGRGIETFLAKNQKPSFEAIELKEITTETPEGDSKRLVDNQKNLIRMNYTAKGVPPDDIDTLIDLAESSGKLFEKAKASKAELQKGHNDRVAAQLQAEEARIKAEELAIQEEYKKVEGMFAKNDFDGIAIPAEQLKTFKDALLKLDAHGHSLIDYKKAKLTLGQRLFIDFLILNDFKGVSKGKPATNKTFTFQKASKENDARNGGRLRGAGGTGGGTTKQPISNLKEFFANNLQQTG